MAFPPDGRYRLANANLEMELRIDLKDSKIISGDLFSTNRLGREYLASFRTPPGMDPRSSSQALAVIIEDRRARRASGSLQILTNIPEATSVTLTSDTTVDALPVGRAITFAGQFEGTSLRRLGLEVEVEADITRSPEWQQNGHVFTIESCLSKAGFDVYNTGDRSTIPKLPDDQGGWDDAQLHGLMTDFARVRLDRPDWQLQALFLDKPRKVGLNGIMFDSGKLDLNDLPRQGFALFEHEIRRPVTGADGTRAERPDWERKTIQTFIHELGHGLNLAHRFERQIGRANSTSFMNYDWKYLGGRNKDRFWRDFNFTFDNDELAFLRHGAYPSVVPGGAAFHSIPYWENDGGGYVPYQREKPTTELKLELHPPQCGTLFEFSQPVLLSINLFNDTQQPLDLPTFLLDPKSGLLDILVRKIGSKQSNDDQPHHFKPLIHRCMDLNPTIHEQVMPGQYLSNNINLTFGAAGFTFMEPGAYEVTAILSIPIDRNNAWHVASPPLRIQVAYPHSKEEEQTADSMFRNDVGHYLALGGSDVLCDAAEQLESIVKRRQHRRKNVTDPLVINILRCQAINHLRVFQRYENGVFKLRNANKEKASDLIENIQKGAKKVLDPYSAKEIVKLAEKMQKSSKDK